MKNIKLNKFISIENIKTQDFAYGDIEGTAEIIGWQIIIFKIKDNVVSAIRLDFTDSNNSELIAIANNIIEEISFPIKVNDHISKAKKILGRCLYVDDIYEGILRYHYLNGSYLVCIAEKEVDHTICLIEIMVDKEIIAQSLENLE